MIECRLDNHKDIFYSPVMYANHILTEHHKKDVPTDLLRWAKRFLK